MALADVTTTFNLADYLGNTFDVRRTKVYLTTNVESNIITDTSTGEVRLGGGTVAVDEIGNVTATHWAPGVDGNPTSWQTTYHIDGVDNASRERTLVSVGPFTVTTSGLLTALLEEQAVPAEYLTRVTTLLDGYVTDAEAARDAAEAARDEAVDISGIAIDDDIVEALIQPGVAGPKTKAALNGAYAVRVPSTKSPFASWKGKHALWVGTSIPQQGVGSGDSYAHLATKAVGADVDNRAWAGSHARFDPSLDPTDVNTVKALSMTEDDRLAMVALYPTSTYADTDPVTKASQMTADARLAAAYATQVPDVFVLDHNHNDRAAPAGR